MPAEIVWNPAERSDVVRGGIVEIDRFCSRGSPFKVWASPGFRIVYFVLAVAVILSIELIKVRK